MGCKPGRPGCRRLARDNCCLGAIRMAMVKWVGPSFHFGWGIGANQGQIMIRLSTVGRRMQRAAGDAASAISLSNRWGHLRGHVSTYTGQHVEFSKVDCCTFQEVLILELYHKVILSPTEFILVGIYNDQMGLVAKRRRDIRPLVSMSNWVNSRESAGLDANGQGRIYYRGCVNADGLGLQQGEFR